MKKPLQFLRSAFWVYLSFIVFFEPKAFAGSTFDELHGSFEKADAPLIKGMDGYWAGRCVSQDHPDDLRPGLYVYRPIKDEHEFPPTRLSFSYYWNKEWAPETFDDWTQSQISQSKELTEWFAKEQWQKIIFQGNSMVTYFAPTASVKFKREVRFFHDEFNDLILLKVTRIDSEQAEPQTLCYFKNKIANLPEESGAKAYSIQIRNAANASIRYTFRFGDHYQWSQQKVEHNEIQTWNQTVISGNPIIRFDSSFFPGYQMKQYLLDSGNYVFVRTAFGVDLMKENCCGKE